MLQGFEPVPLLFCLTLLGAVLLGPVLTRHRPRLGRWVAGGIGVLAGSLTGWLIGAGFSDGEINGLLLYGGSGLAAGALSGGLLGALASRRPGASRVLLCYGLLVLPVPGVLWARAREEQVEARWQQRLRCHLQVGWPPERCVEAGCEVTVECLQPEPCVPRARSCEPRPE